jgi:Tol biopolymer transport system component
VFLFDRDTGQTERVSVRSNGDQATGGNSFHPAISADGRWITYTSNATNLVANDTNTAYDVFLFDRNTGTTQRVSVRSNGDQATGGDSRSPAISADGRWVTYTSNATNLVANDTNSVADTFLFDRDTGTTQRVSVRSNGAQATGGASTNSVISVDGRWITYYSDATNLVANDTNAFVDVFLFDRSTGQTERVSVRSNGDQATGGSSFEPGISADGRWITYRSHATNLVANDTNSVGDVFLFDRSTGATQRVSVGSNGDQATGGHSYSPVISGDGRWITYYSDAANLVANDTNSQADVFLARMW